MPKQKTHSGAAKRFKITGNGKVKFRRANRNHLLRKRTKKNKRHLRVDGIVQSTEMGHVQDLLRLPTGRK